jgi:ABC-2 type transport system permease protein
MARLLEAVSWALPLTYAYDALQRATDPGALGWQVAADAAVVLGAALISLALGALTLHRRTA